MTNISCQVSFEFEEMKQGLQYIPFLQKETRQARPRYNIFYQYR